MISKRARVTATATVLGLGALAGVAMETNHGLPATVASVNAGGVVTSASATTSAVGTEATAKNAPIVTRASGAGALAPAVLED